MEELWGLAVHSTNSQFLTGGHDKNLILWDTVTHLPVWSKVSANVLSLNILVFLPTAIFALLKGFLVSLIKSSIGSDRKFIKKKYRYM